MPLCGSSRNSTLHHAGDGPCVSNYSVDAASAASCLFRPNLRSILQCLNNIVCQNNDGKSFLFLLVQVSVLQSVVASPHLPDHPHLPSISPNADLSSPQVFTKLIARFFFFFLHPSLLRFTLFSRLLLHRESAFLSAASPHHLKIKPCFFFFSFKPITCVSRQELHFISTPEHRVNMKMGQRQISQRSSSSMKKNWSKRN